MAVRNIVKIDEEKCNGCGLCVNACAEGAIQIVDGKAKLVSEIYCDGLGACLGSCPQDAITVEQREAAGFDEQATEKHLTKMKKEQANTPNDFVCPGMMAKTLRDEADRPEGKVGNIKSQLSQWPIQLKLVSPQAPYFADADLLLVADCVPFAMGDFHDRFLKAKSIVIGCPKLDDTAFYIEKLAAILKANKLNSLTVIHMEVPCCSGLTYIAQQAIIVGGARLDFEDVTVSLQGEALRSETISCAGKAQQ